MSNPPTFRAIQEAIVGPDFRPTWAFLKKLIEFEQKLNGTLTLLGQINAAAKVAGRSEGIATTLSKLNANGLVLDADQVAADGATFKRVNESQRAGGGRAFNALTANSRLAGSFRMNPINAVSIPLSETVLQNDGVSTVIEVLASTMLFGEGEVSYAAGSVDPGFFGSFYVFADDPEFAGGAVAYQASNDPKVLLRDGRVYFGAIQTINGTPATGGGSTGGTSEATLGDAAVGGGPGKPLPL